MACCAAPAQKRKPRRAPLQPEHHARDDGARLDPKVQQAVTQADRTLLVDPETVQKAAAAKEKRASAKRAAAKARAAARAAALADWNAKSSAVAAAIEQGEQQRALADRATAEASEAPRKHGAGYEVGTKATAQSQQQGIRRSAAPPAQPSADPPAQPSVGSFSTFSSSPPLMIEQQSSSALGTSGRDGLASSSRQSAIKSEFHANAAEWSPLKTPEGRLAGAAQNDDEALTPGARSGRRRHARTPVIRARHKDSTHPENDKHSETEWWMPGVDANDENGRLKGNALDL